MRAHVSVGKKDLLSWSDSTGNVILNLNGVCPQQLMIYLPIVDNIAEAL